MTPAVIHPCTVATNNRMTWPHRSDHTTMHESQNPEVVRLSGMSSLDSLRVWKVSAICTAAQTLMSSAFSPVNRAVTVVPGP